MKSTTPSEQFQAMKLQDCSWEHLSELDRNELGTVMEVNKISFHECVVLLELWRLRRLEACT
jgi:hypothetical protein